MNNDFVRIDSYIDKRCEFRHRQFINISGVRKFLGIYKVIECAGSRSIRIVYKDGEEETFYFPTLKEAVKAFKKLYKTTNLHMKSSVTISKKIHKGKEIRKACESMPQEFTSSDIKRVLEQSPNEEIKNITIQYVSHLLSKLEKEKKITFIRRNIEQSGSPRLYEFNRKQKLVPISSIDPTGIIKED